MNRSKIDRQFKVMAVKLADENVIKTVVRRFMY